MSILATLSHFVGLHERRSTAEIDAEVVEELEFHLAMRADDLGAAGLSPEQARRSAERHFGDFESIRRQCRTIDLEERIMLLRIQTVLIVCLVIVIASMAWGMHSAERRARNEVEMLRARLAQVAHMQRGQDHSESETEEPSLLEKLGGVTTEEVRQARLSLEATSAGEGASSDLALTAEEWRDLFALRPQDWRYGLSLGKRIAKLPPEEGARSMRAVWPSLTPEVKRQALKAFVFDGGHPKAIAILHLAASDTDVETQNRAFQYLRAYAFQDFSQDWQGYCTWSAACVDLPLAQVLTESANHFIARVRELEGAELSRELKLYERVDFDHATVAGVDLARALREAGGLQLLERMLADSSEELQCAAASWSEKLDPGPEWLSRFILPRIEQPGELGDSVLAACLRALGQPESAFARAAVTAFLRARFERRVASASSDSADSVLWAAAESLAAMGDPAAIPEMIALIARRPCYDTVYGIGYFGLGQLTGVEYDQSHDGDWWLAWWEANKSRFQRPVSELALPPQED